ncbi:unnamed protein product [marine sediment metagenome]|uniref:Uncharacterized protein n=1 Tax=marine sediment metagenome TaxID=412755 RepID=X0VHK0_9ZZZZ
MPEAKYKPHRTLRTVKKKTGGILNCRDLCSKKHGVGTEEWFTCVEACQKKAKEESVG